MFKKFLSYPRAQALILLVVTYSLVWLSGYLVPLAYRQETQPVRIVLDLVIVVFLAYKSGAFDKILETFKWKNLIHFLPFLVLMTLFWILGRQIYFYFVPALDWMPMIGIDQMYFLGGFPFLLRILYPYVIAPIFEELVYREYTYWVIGSKWIAFIVSSMIFSWAHTGFTIDFFYYFSGAMAICLVYQRRNNVCESMIMHGLMNFLVAFVPAISYLW